MNKRTSQYLAAAALNPDRYRGDFYGWLHDNSHIMLAFETEAERVWARGRRHYSARTIVEYLRHETLLAETSGEWKINDWWTPDMARLFVALHPDKPLFEFREHKAAA